MFDVLESRKIEREVVEYQIAITEEVAASHDLQRFNIGQEV